MRIGILGKKIGMTQIFDEEARQIAVTVINVQPNYVLQERTLESDGYQAVQLCAGPCRTANKPRMGHFKKAGLSPATFVREIRSQGFDGVHVGNRVCLDSFAVGDYVNVTGYSIGKGYQGVVKRHGHSGGPDGHGSKFHREPGSIGAKAGGKACRKKVDKGKSLPGQMGNQRVTVHNLKVVALDLENNLLIVAGAVPGGGGNWVVIRNSFRDSSQKQWKVDPAGQLSNKVDGDVKRIDSPSDEAEK